MTLIALDSFADALACPRCKSELARKDEGYTCAGEQCGQHFDVVDGQPVLVDFDDSILARDDIKRGAAESLIERGNGGTKRRVLQALLPANRVAATNADRFLHLAGATARILIIGGGSRGEGTDQLYAEGGPEIIAFDIYRSDLTQFIADAHRIPLADASVDAVWIQAVLEHVLDPWRVAEEIHRVLKPAGIVYAETPFMQQVHEGAFDFTRFTESGHRWLFRRFEEIDSGVVLGTASQLLWSIDHVVRGVFRSVTAGVIAKTLFFWLGYLDRLIPRAYASDGASAVYFLGRKSETAIGPKDMVAFYKGAHARR